MKPLSAEGGDVEPLFIQENKRKKLPGYQTAGSQEESLLRRDVFGLKQLRCLLLFGSDGGDNRPNGRGKLTSEGASSPAPVSCQPGSETETGAGLPAQRSSVFFFFCAAALRISSGNNHVSSCRWLHRAA